MNQTAFLGEWWSEIWTGMPEFIQEEVTPFRTVEVYLKDEAALEEFERRIGGQLYHGKWTWYPPREYATWKDLRYVGGDGPRYPVYIISKGRWESRMTARSLDAMGVPYRIVVEPQEHDAYAAVIPREKILVLPFSNLGQGSIPARNWVWEHALHEGATRHWILDDNIQGFYRLNRNAKRLVLSGATFRAAEEFTDRWENVGLSGFQYESFAARRSKWPPFAMNTRVYSCILIRNDLPFRWRGRYNEDTDLSLRVLKSGLATLLFYAFLANKTATMRMTGGNTDELYKGDGRLKMALAEQHPDVTKVVWRWNRWQHYVDYTPFESIRLIPRGAAPSGQNEYGMRLEAV